MTIASGSRHEMNYIVESTFGTTPATPAFTPIRHTGSTLGLNKDSFQSAELRSDRQIADFRHGNKQVSGDINFELSYGSLDDLLQAVLCGTWATDTPGLGTDQLKAGTTRRSFTIERDFSDLTTRYYRYTGCSFNTLSLSVAPNAIVTGTLGIVGQGQDTPASVIITGATYGAETTVSPFDSFSGSINEGGSAIAVVTAIDFTLDNGLEPLYVVGSDETLEPSIGRSNVTGTVTAYFEDATLVNKFINETESSLDFTLVDLAGNTYFFDFPRIKYSSGQPDVSDEGPVTITFDFQALLDATENTNFLINRTDA